MLPAARILHRFADRGGMAAGVRGGGCRRGKSHGNSADGDDQGRQDVAQNLRFSMIRHGALFLYKTRRSDGEHDHIFMSGRETAR